MQSVDRKLLRSPLLLSLIAVILQYAYSSEAEISEVEKLVVGNSLKVINRYGSSIIYFEENRSFRHLGDSGQSSQGTWRPTEDGVCLTVFPQPINLPREFCLNLKSRSYGKTWIEIDPRNGEIKRTLLQGHPKLENQ